jgi:hypothetical protein
MTGIEELKKKTKLSMDEMYEISIEKVDNQKDGKPDNQPDNPTTKPQVSRTTVNPANKKNGKVTAQLNNQPAFQEPNHLDYQEVEQPESQVNQRSEAQAPNFSETHIHRRKTEPAPGSLETPINRKWGEQDQTEKGATRTFITKGPYPQKPATFKMTFNLTEEIYKAFNDLYAKRMLQGRKTEKSELICEAIQWLIQMEEGSP